MSLRFYKGTEILCPECKELVCTLICDVFDGDLFESSQVKFNPKYQPFVKGDMAISRCCNVTYACENQGVYTKDGWS